VLLMKKLMRMVVMRISAENRSKDTRKKRCVLAMFLRKAYLQKQYSMGTTCLLIPTRRDVEGYTNYYNES